MYTPYLTDLTERARTLRKTMTPAEKMLWNAIRRKQLDGLKFVCQKPIHTYIADFYCAEQLLVIEVDGSIHDDVKEYDAIRTVEINSFDIRVIRFTNDQVLNHLPSVLTAIRSFIQQHPKQQ